MHKHTHTQSHTHRYTYLHAPVILDITDVFFRAYFKESLQLHRTEKNF